jgi:hypothetical protein
MATPKRSVRLEVLKSDTKKELARFDTDDMIPLPVGTPVSLDNLPELLGYNLRRSVEDRRRHGIFLTPAGIKKLAQLKREVTAHDKKFTSRFTPSEYATLLEFLQRVRR